MKILNIEDGKTIMTERYEHTRIRENLFQMIHSNTSDHSLSISKSKRIAMADTLMLL